MGARGPRVTPVAGGPASAPYERPGAGVDAGRGAVAPTTARLRANDEQRRAADPAASTFVEASAGSGKTKLLTDRLLRLMLANVPPQRIQCLTFTNAAAAEMAVRLHDTLGRWVTMSDAELDAALGGIDVLPSEGIRNKARALFAQVLDVEGGMRIGTIHAFCQSLLRRFPLEAALSPHFQLMEDTDAANAMKDARETMLMRADSATMRRALEVLAGLASAQQFGEHVATLQKHRDRMQRALALGDELLAAQRRALGVTADSEAALMRSAVSWPEEARLRDAAAHVRDHGSAATARRATDMLEWLALDAATRLECWEYWCGYFHKQDGQPRAASGFVNGALAKTQPTLADVFLTEAERIAAVQDGRRALKVAGISHALVMLAAPTLHAYAERKDQGSLLDYDDLIGCASRLLIDPGAAWVLYKLDGGIDHLLLDEVQDTAPAQWRIAHALTDEFFAGAGARDADRTVFAVGDKKQSIFSFQGADVASFDQARDHWRRRVQGARQEFRNVALDVSFRSSEPVLALVDAVFADPVAARGVTAPGELRHYADRAGVAGAVELWPLAPLADVAEPDPWTVPDRNQGQQSAPQRLADRLADWIAHETDGSMPLESKGRPLRPGDVMVLVRRRDAFGRALVRALKARGVPVAGLDRLLLTEQPAVQDLMALGDALLLPQDELRFACMLTSPLGGLSDESLMDLSVGRGRSLWETLRDRAHERPEWQAAWNFFAALLSRVDYLTPHALFSHALGPLGGRARLFARLGAEAAEPVDELLNSALAYARAHPPSLQGFLHWQRRSADEVKRQQDVAAHSVRIMTVHGAKGLQAPLVILPDTTGLPPAQDGVLWAGDPQTRTEVPILCPRKELRCRNVATLRDAAAARGMEEHNRLLYVALTRAEDRLLVCGWQTKREVRDTSWYRLVERGFARMETTRTAFDDWGEMERYALPQRVPAESEPGLDMAPAELPLPAWAGRAPDWRTSPPPAEPARPTPLAPSRPEGAELGPVPAAASPLAERHVKPDRFRRGQLLHALLQHLPALDPAARPAAARSWLARPGHEIPPREVEPLAAEVLAILAHPELAPLFGPDSRAEVPLTGVVGNAVVGGLVDRLVVLPDRVLLADYKTNRRPPETDDDIPVLYLRQLAAYRAVLRQIFPDRPVRCALIWTQAARVSMLADALLDSHAPLDPAAAPSHLPAQPV
jgi:ATP-dependent helicase/nuclease subunit A